MSSGAGEYEEFVPGELLWRCGVLILLEIRILEGWGSNAAFSMQHLQNRWYHSAGIPRMVSLMLTCVPRPVEPNNPLELADWWFFVRSCRGTYHGFRLWDMDIQCRMRHGRGFLTTLENAQT